MRRSGMLQAKSRPSRSVSSGPRPMSHWIAQEANQLDEPECSRNTASPLYSCLSGPLNLIDFSINTPSLIFCSLSSSPQSDGLPCSLVSQCRNCRGGISCPISKNNQNFTGMLTICRFADLPVMPGKKFAEQLEARVSSILNFWIPNSSIGHLLWTWDGQESLWRINRNPEYYVGYFC